MNKDNIKFNKYDSEDNYKNALGSEVDKSTFSVVRTAGCNSNENNNNSGNVKDLYISDTKLTDVYNSRKIDSSKDLETTVGVGGIPAGTKLSELTEMPLGMILDKMFFKTYRPRIKRNVSASISYSTVDFIVGSTIKEVTNSMVSVDNGVFEIEQPNGEFKETTTLSKGLSDISVSYMPSDRIVNDGTNKISVSINLLDGDSPKDSDGKSCDDLKYNGGTIQKTITIYPYFEWFATSLKSGESYSKVNDISTQTVKRSMGCSNVSGVEVDICGGNKEHPQVIKVPGNISNCKTYVQGNWVDYSFNDEWDVDTEEITNKNGVKKIYKVYTYKQGHFVDGSASGFKLKFDVKKIN